MSRHRPPPTERPFYILLMVNSLVITTAFVVAGASFALLGSQEVAVVAFLVTLAVLTVFRGRLMEIFWPSDGGRRPPRRRR